MMRFALGFVTALFALLLAVVISPVDVSVGLRSARNTKPAVYEIAVPLTEWCKKDVPAVIASSGLVVDIENVLGHSDYPFVTNVARISKATESVVSPESSEKAMNLANELRGMCLPKTYLTLRGSKAFQRAVNTVSQISISKMANEKSWVVLEFDTSQQTATLFRMPEDIRDTALD